MTTSTRRWRTAAFLVICAMLIAVAVAFGRAGVPLSPTRASTVDRAVLRAPGTTMNEAALRTALEPVARRFLNAFFRYEVGALDRPTRESLRATATASFVAELLGAPPRGPARVQQPEARLGRLDISVASLAPPRVLVSGSARRGPEPEQFSFLFDSVNGVWRASGAGE